MAKIRKITKDGQAVKGALAAYIVPRLAADHAIKPGDLDNLLKQVEPAATFAAQIPSIITAVTAAFDKKLQKDTDLDDLPEILEALKEAGDDDDDEETEDEKNARLEQEAKDKKAKDKAKGSVAADDDEETEDEKNARLEQEAKDKKAKDEKEDKLKNAAEGKDVPVSKQAMDAALAADRIAERKRLQSLFSAADEVAPVLGKIDTLACDSAEDIYKMALDHLEVPTEGVHPSAFKPMFAREMSRPVIADRASAVVMDAAAEKSFSDMYPIVPIQA